MENLSLHIEYLMSTHDTVIVPGLGAIIVSHRDAYITDDDRIIPPCRTIDFNPHITHDDGLLASSYSRRAGVDMSQARICLDRDIREFRKQLEEDIEVSLGRIGVFSISAGYIIFRPYQNPEERLASLGMPIRSLRTFENRPTVGETGTTSENSVYSNEANEDSSGQYLTFRISKRFLRSAAAVVAVIAIAFSALLGIRKPDITQQQASVIPVVTITNDNTERDSKESFNKIPATDKQIEILTETSDIDAPEPLPLHHLIVATFATQKEAEKYIAHKSTQRQLYIVSGGKYHRVAAACADNREELQKLLNSNEIKRDFDQAWIWEEK